MTKPDLMAELAEVPVVAYAWRKEGMNGWALGHNPPTPNMPDFDKYEVRELTFRTHHAELEAVARDAARYRAFKPLLAAANFYPEDPDGLDLGEGIALIFMLPKGTHVSSNLDAVIDAMHNSAREG